MTRTTEGRLLDGVWFVAWAVASSVWIVSASGHLSSTFDEPFYLGAGLDFFHTGSNHRLLDAGTMPLPIHVAVLPVWVWERFRGVAFNPETDLDQILPVLRLGTLVFWWLLLGYGWYAARQIGGAWGGRLSVAFLACEPNLLAHAGLATTDLAVTACLLAFWVHFRAGRGGPWRYRVGVPAVWFAVAVLAKASAVAFGGIGMIVLEVDHRLRAAGGTRPLGTAVAALLGRRFWVDSIQIVLLGFVLVFVYCGSDRQASPEFVAWAKALPEGRMHDAMLWWSENLCIFSNAGSALGFQFRHNVWGSGVYLLGFTDPGSLWYYFPVALSIKTATPLLLLPLLLVAVSPRSLANWACALAVALLLFSLTCRVQIGVRFMLPLIALGAVGTAAALARAVQDRPAGWRRRVVVAGAALGLAWSAWSAAAVWPNGLCYANDLWGGPRLGYLRLSDSNYDWGQGLKELAAWRRRHDDAPLEVWYFGADHPGATRVAKEFDPWTLAGDRPEDFRARFRGRRLAASTTLVYGTAFRGDPPADADAAQRQYFLRAQALLAYLRDRPPDDRTTTYLIYDFREGNESAGD
jgi:hypothetical protein